MPREYRDYLEDISDSIRKIKAFTRNMTLEEFTADEKTRDAVLRNLEVIGEAVKNLPDEIKEDNTEIDWKGIAGLRDILSHAYFGIDDEIVWDIIQNKIPELEDKIDALMEKE